MWKLTFFFCKQQRLYGPLTPRELLVAAIKDSGAQVRRGTCNRWEAMYSLSNCIAFDSIATFSIV